MNEKKLNILLSFDLYDKHLDVFKQHCTISVNWYRVDFLNLPDNYYALLKNAHVIVSRKDLSEKEYQNAPNLKLLQIPIAGYESINCDRAEKYGVFVCNNGGANAISVSEHVFLLILALKRQFIFHYQSIKHGPWRNKKYSNLEMANKIIGVIGLGNCGKEVVKRAKAFEMEIWYYDIRRASKEYEDLFGLKFMPFKTIMREVDIITFHVPLTRLTDKIINKTSLKWMKPDSILINTSRGGIIDEHALSETLKKNQIKGACLDVFENEPLSKDSPLRKLENIILTPHCAASYESIFRMCKNVSKNIERIYYHRKPLFRVVDWNKVS